MTPGVNNLFTLLEAFAKDTAIYTTLRLKHDEGTLQYSTLKKTLTEAMITTLRPIQKRRKEFEEQPDYVAHVLIEGTQKARAIAEKTLEEVKKKTGLL